MIVLMKDQIRLIKIYKISAVVLTLDTTNKNQSM